MSLIITRLVISSVTLKSLVFRFRILFNFLLPLLSKTDGTYATVEELIHKERDSMQTYSKAASSRENFGKPSS